MEKYSAYKLPYERLPTKIHFWKLSDSGEGLKITCYASEDFDELIDIHFETTLAYRVIDEGDRLELWNNPTLTPNCFIFTVTNSEFIEYFHAQSKNIHENQKLFHFLVVTTDDCIDIITEHEPKVLISKNNM